MLHEFEEGSVGLPRPGDASANACVAVEAVAQIVADHGDAVAAAAVAASERAFARLPVCSCGSHPTSHCVGARRGRQCAECPTVIPHRRAGWLCVGCDSFRWFIGMNLFFNVKIMKPFNVLKTEIQVD